MSTIIKVILGIVVIVLAWKILKGILGIAIGVALAVALVVGAQKLLENRR
jgi:F0F1-type ATP synthase assembly protein I